jgi:hypothetical protein
MISKIKGEMEISLQPADILRDVTCCTLLVPFDLFILSGYLFRSSKASQKVGG